MPYGFLPSSLETPGGSSSHGTLDVCKALFTTSFKSACLVSLPALNLHDRFAYWSSNTESNWHWQGIGLQLCSYERTGIASSHIPDSDSAATSNLAVSTWLDSSKSVSNLALHMGSFQLLCPSLDSAAGSSVTPLKSSHNVPASINSVFALSSFQLVVHHLIIFHYWPKFNATSTALNLFCFIWSKTF